MSKVAHGRVLIVKIVQSHIVVSRRGQSVVLVVLVTQRGQSFYVVSRLDRRGQSLWSVVLRGWCLYSMVVMHTYLLRHMAGKNRGQCLDKCTGVGRTRVCGHETQESATLSHKITAAV